MSRPVVASNPRSRLRSRFAFRDPSLLFARATLEGEALVLRGWTWRGRYHRRLPLDRILQADVRGGEQGDELILWLFDGEVLRLRIDEAPAWKAALNALEDDAG